MPVAFQEDFESVHEPHDDSDNDIFARVKTDSDSVVLSDYAEVRSVSSTNLNEWTYQIRQEIYDARIPLQYTIGIGEDVVPRGLIRCRASFWIHCVLLAVIFFSVIVSPLTILNGGGWYRTYLVPGGVSLLLLDLFLDIVICALLLLQFNTSFISSRNVEVCSRRHIRSHLLRSKAFVLCLLSTSSHLWFVISDWQFLMIVKTLRLAISTSSILSTQKFIQKFTATRLLFLMLLMYALFHVTACSFGYVGGYYEKVAFIKGYVLRPGEYHPDALGYLYSHAFTDAVYLLSSGIDDPLGTAGGTFRSANFFTMLLVWLAAPFGCVVGALGISVIVQEQAKFYVMEVDQEEKRAFLKRALLNLHIPPQLQRRVFSLTRFHEMNHDLKAFEYLFDRKHINRPLHCALSLYLYKDSVLTNSFFVGKQPSYILNVIRILEFRTYVPGDYATRYGEIGGSMYFVARGVLSILVPNLSECVAQAEELQVLHKGDYFGEVTLVMDIPRLAWIMATTYAVLSELYREKVEDLWVYYPEYRLELVRQAEEITANSAHYVESGTPKHVGAPVEVQAEAAPQGLGSRRDSLRASPHGRTFDIPPEAHRKRVRAGGLCGDSARILLAETSGEGLAKSTPMLAKESKRFLDRAKGAAAEVTSALSPALGKNLRGPSKRYVSHKLS